MKKFAQIMMYGIPLVMVIGILAMLVTSGKNVKTDGDNVASESITQDADDVESGATNNSQTQGSADANEKQETESEGENATTEDTGVETVGTEADATEVENTEIETNKAELSDASDSADTTIIFAGDVLFANAFKAGYDANGIEGVISEELLNELQDADIFMVNNEFPFGEQGEPMADKQYTFQCEPSYVTALQEMGVDVVSLANNHVLDYGKESLRDTFKTLDEAEILYGGAGETVERAKEIQMIEVNGKKFGFLAVSRVVPTGDWKVENSAPGVYSCYDDTDLIKTVEEAKKECDFLAVYPHWGVEHQTQPEDYQTKIAENCLAAGADIVVGSHTHCLQGVQFMDEKPVCYSLGNFVFGQTIDQSAILKVTITAEGAVCYQYLPVYAAGGVTHLATNAKAEQIYEHLNQISFNAKITKDGIITEKND